MSSVLVTLLAGRVLGGQAHGAELIFWWSLIVVLAAANAWVWSPAYQRRLRARDERVAAMLHAQAWFLDEDGDEDTESAGRHRR